MTDKISEIRARHEAGARGMLPLPALAEALDDRATLLAEVERLRASNKRLHRALFRIAGKAPFADDPWTIAAKTLKREAKP